MSASRLGEYRYSIEVKQSESECQSGIRRSASHPSELIDNLVGNRLSNCWDVFQLGARSNPEGPLFGSRKSNTFEWISYRESEQYALCLGSALLDMDIIPEVYIQDEVYEHARNLRPLGIFSKNRMEWFICEQAANAFNFALVPFYDTLSKEVIRYIIEETQLSIIAGSVDVLDILLDAAEDLKFYKVFLSFDISIPVETINRASNHEVKICYFNDLIQWKNQRIATPGNSNSVSTLSYTSGTTGNPKGVILTHRNILSTVCASLRGPLTGSFEVSHKDVHISYLPLGHVFERAICNILLAVGASIGIYSGDITKLLDDIQLLKPTIFISVPRLFNRINDKVFGRIKEKSSFAQYLFNLGISTKLKALRSQGTLVHKFWDTIVFGKVKQLMGNRLRYMIVGGAPIDALVQDRIKVIFSTSLAEGYGLTETVGCSFISDPSDALSGHIGGPVPSLEYKLESVPEFNYFISDPSPCGEILVRGPCVTKGYFRNPIQTQEAFDEDGWFHTGDIAMLIPNGALKIIDRKKNIFKLAQGEYVAPEKIESVYQQSLFVSQIFVFGRSSHYALVGIVVPDEVEAQRWLVKHGRPRNTLNLAQLCVNEDFKESMLKDMEKIANLSGLKGFEKLKQVHLIPEPFTEENGLLTPTMKIRRRFAQTYFAEQIQELYSKITR